MYRSHLTFLFALFLFTSILFAPSLTHARQQRTRAGTPAVKPATGTKPNATRPAAQQRQAAPTAPTAATPSAAAGGVATAAAVADECGCEPRALPEVLAVVNGVRVTRQDISPATQEQINKFKQQVVEARAAELDLQINSRLLEAEAKKRGTTPSKLLDQEIVAKVTDPTDAEAQAFYDQNKARIQAEFPKVRADILGYLREQRQREAAGALATRLRAGADLKILVAKPTPPTSDAERARVFATVNGQQITSADVEDSLKPLVASVQEQLYHLRKQEVDMKINDILLSEEAQKRKITMQALLDAEITSKAVAVTEADAQKFFNENKARLSGDFAQIKPQIIQYLEEQGRRRGEATFAQRLRNAASVQTFIRPPEPLIFDVATDDQPAKGNPSASVTIVEFTDFQCPSCAQTHPVMDRLATEYGDRVRFVFRDFPLVQHENAFRAAEAAEAAREQGKYWEYIALLFRNQSALGPQNLREYALAAGLDVARFDAAIKGGKVAEKVQRDLADGQKLGVGSTPTIFVNGRRVNERSYEGLKLIIEDALKSPAKK